MAKSVESVFIFQEGSEGEPNAAAPTYDAIVVEQWTVIDVSGEIFLFPHSVAGFVFSATSREEICALFQKTR